MLLHVRIENMLKRKVASTSGSNSQPPGHESDRLTTEHLGRASEREKILSSTLGKNHGQARDPTNLFLTLSKRQILDSSKLKDFADDNFDFVEDGRKFF